MRQRWSCLLSNLVLAAALWGCGTGAGPATASGTPPPPPVAAPSGAPVTIYDSLNESHSTSWAQRAPDGTLGIAFASGPRDRTGKSSQALVLRTVSPEGAERDETVATGPRMDTVVLLYDAASAPHLFLATSSGTEQRLTRCWRTASGAWAQEPVATFMGEFGQYVYELAAASGPGGRQHLLALVTRADPDSPDYFHAFEDANLIHLSGQGGTWTWERISTHDTIYTLDENVKALRRQALAVDREGTAHVVFGVQESPWTRQTHGALRYATNRTGAWRVEPALAPHAPQDDAGWMPSLALDSQGRPAVASVYVSRVATYSALSATLQYSVRQDGGTWTTTPVATRDDGYHGSDGRDYTGAMPHLLFDRNGTPHIAFSDIASFHWGGVNLWNVGQVRLANLGAEGWRLRTLHAQPSPSAYFTGREMDSLCLLPAADGLEIVGQELASAQEGVYQYQLLRIRIP